MKMPSSMTRRNVSSLLAALPLVAAGMAALGENARAASKVNPMPKIGDRIAVPNLTLLDGTEFNSSTADGRIIVLYWWASWCPFCAVQTPEIQKLWNKNRSRGLMVLGFATDDKPDDAREYIRKRDYTFPSGVNGLEVERVLPRPGRGLPITIVRNREGRVVMSEQGQLFPEDIEQIARFL